MIVSVDPINVNCYIAIHRGFLMPPDKKLSPGKKKNLQMLVSPEYRAAVDLMAHAAKDGNATNLLVRLIAKEAKRLKIELPPR